MKTRHILTCIVLLLYILSNCSETKAQKYSINAGFNGFFDNREYFHEYAKPQTIFGTRAFASTGISIHENYTISIGLDVLYEFGSSISKEDICPLLYFQYHKKPLLFFLGSFHRRNLSILPRILQADTIQYFKPTIEGMFLELRKPWGFQNIWIDWISRQTNTNREVFNIGGSGMLKSSVFFYKHDFLMTHSANSARPQPDDHIRDNGGFYARIGFYNLNKAFPDSLSLSTGYTMSYDRLRNITNFSYRSGSLTEIYFEHKGFGLRSSLYIGEGQLLMEGDDLYSTEYYIRNDLFWIFFRKDHVYGKLEVSLHIVEYLINLSQSIYICVDIGGINNFKSEN